VYARLDALEREHLVNVGLEQHDPVRAAHSIAGQVARVDLAPYGLGAHAGASSSLLHAQPPIIPHNEPTGWLHLARVDHGIHYSLSRRESAAS
jgi:hypothetical protein